jgi:hypothetical protein
MLKRRLPVGFVVPAQPVERDKPPTGAEWIHEIKHDGYRMIVRRDTACPALQPQGDRLDRAAVGNRE